MSDSDLPPVHPKFTRRLSEINIPEFRIPERGRYEPKATIFQKRKLEKFAQSRFELPERFYELIETLGRDQADCIIEYCELCESYEETAKFAAEADARIAAANLAAENLRRAERERNSNHTTLVVIFAMVLIGVVLLVFHGQKTEESKNESSSKPAEKHPTAKHSPPYKDAVPFAPTPPSETYQANVRYSQQAAVKKYPTLGLKDTPLNRKFLARLAEWKSANDPRLGKSDWPERLADECAK